MDLYIEIAGGNCIAVYYTGVLRHEDITTHILDYDNSIPYITPPEEERTYLY
jgi:hypothetical protein